MSINIVVGLQAENTIKLAPYGAQQSEARSLGLVKGGITIEHDQTQQEIMVDQYLGPIDKITTSESMKIKTTLAEATLENIATAMGATYAEDSSSLNIGTQENNYYTLYLNVKGANGTKRVYTFWKCKINGGTSQVYKRDGETVADIEFSVLVDTTKTAAQRFGFVTDDAQ